MATKANHIGNTMAFSPRYLITGASDGIGAELAKQLAAQGARLALAARSLEGLEKVASQCRDIGAEKVLVIPTDVSNEDQCRRLVAQTIDTFDGLDCLVNNAGISMHGRFAQLSDCSSYERLFRVNVMGAIWCTHAALSALKASKGQVVAVSSLAGKTGVPGRTTYCTSKFAMDGFYQALRVELEEEDGVNILTVFPGVVNTNIRYHGLNAKGDQAGVSALKEDGAMSVEECVRQMIRAMDKRQRELIMTPKARIGLMLKGFFPELVDKMARNAVKPGH
jgi:short-subunit dehydrogenase